MPLGYLHIYIYFDASFEKEDAFVLFLLLQRALLDTLNHVVEKTIANEVLNTGVFIGLNSLDSVLRIFVRKKHERCKLYGEHLLSLNKRGLV